MLVSPAEPPRLKVVGKVSSLTEQWGCDFLIAANGKWVGVQRKEVKDLLSSVADGRLQREVAQMNKCDYRILIVEGKITWTNEGEMVGRQWGRAWTRKQWRALLWSVRAKGIWVEYTDDVGDTIQTLQWLESWWRKDGHTSLDRRPGPTSVWGKVGNEDYARHLVMGLPGVGYELADRIVRQFGVPFCWKISEEDLMTIPGIGKKKAEMIYKGLETANG